jgi:hypothetical protein
MDAQPLRAVLRRYLGERMYGRLASGRAQVRNAFATVKANVHAWKVARAKKKMDAFLEDPNISRFYMAQSIPYLFEVKTEKRRVFDGLWAGYRNPVTHLRDPIRLVQFMALLDIANAAPDGDYLEIGTHRGESAKLIYKLMDPSRTLYCIDTFEGFVESDLQAEKTVNPASTWQVGNFLETSPEYVASYVGDGIPPANFKAIKGWFPQAYAGLEERRWRFIHLDMDLYEPTRIAMDMLWPRLVPGGVMVFHDYDNLSFPGVKIVVDNFFGKLGLRTLPMGDLWGSVMIVKPRSDAS